MNEYRYPHFTRERLKDDAIFAAGRDPGWPMPDFDVPTTDGGRLGRADLVGGRPALVTFASLTCPMTASAGPVLKRLFREFGDRVRFVTVYVREAHPGEHIPQPKSFDWKMRHARMYRERDAIPWTVGVDDLAGSFHRALGGNSNSAHLMDAAGNVAFRSLWSNDEKVLREALRSVSEGRAGHPWERERRWVSLLRGVARADDVVRPAGREAVEDLRREAPLLFAAAEAAWVWRTLTPFGRAVVGGTALLAAATAWAGLRLVRRATEA